MAELGDKIMVCIHCMTYNHEKYLADALEGFVMQKTDFPFVAVVIDDCSTDGTANVLREYEARYPEIIKAVYLQENYYSQHKSKQPFLDPWDSNAKYIALCEGDDYWTDPLKLQKQVDILESNNNIGLVCSGFSVISENGEIIERCLYKNSEITFEDVLVGNKIGTLTVCYRKDLKKNYTPPKNLLMGDYPLWLHLLSQKKAFQIKEYLANYRFLQGSASHPWELWKSLKFEYDIICVREHYAIMMNCIELVKTDMDISLYNIFQCCYMNNCFMFPSKELKKKIIHYRGLSVFDNIRFWGLKNTTRMRISKNVIAILKRFQRLFI